jgi:Flp pilus assembly protein TadD
MSDGRGLGRVCLHLLVCSDFVAAAILFPLGIGARGQAPIMSASGDAQAASSQAGDGGLAAAATKTAKTESSEQPDALLPEAKSLLQKGMLSDAERALRQYLVQRPDSAEAHYLLGYLLFKGAEASNLLRGPAEGAKVQDPNGVDFLNFREVKARASLVQYTEGAKYQDPGASDLKIVGLDYLVLGYFENAEKWLALSLELDPGDSEAWLYLGRTRFDEHKFKEAVSALEQCLKLDSKNGKAEDNLGLSYAAVGRQEEAIAAYRNAIALLTETATKYAGPYLDLGTLLLEQDRPEEALPFLRQAVEISPQWSRMHEQLGKAYLRLNQLKDAQSALEKAVELSPNEFSPHYLLGQVYQKEGLSEKARVQFDQANVLQGTHSSPTAVRP